MTVRRHADAHFDASPMLVARAARVVLSQCPPYVQTYEVEENAIFKTNVRPYWWLTGTDMTIRLSASTVGTTVSVDTKSQVFILGDVFGFYDRYIQSFFSDLRRVLRTGSPGGTGIQEQVLLDEPTAA